MGCDVYLTEGWSNYQRMNYRYCFRFQFSGDVAHCDHCGNGYWDHSHRMGDNRREWVLIDEAERARVIARFNHGRRSL